MKKFSILFLFLVLLVFSANSFGASIYWTGTGADRLWSTGDNWVGGSSPGTGDVAVIYTVPSSNDPNISSTVNAVCSQLIMGGSGCVDTLTVTGGTLTAGGTVGHKLCNAANSTVTIDINAGTMTFTSADVLIAQNVDTSFTLNMTGGTIQTSNRHIKASTHAVGQSFFNISGGTFSSGGEMTLGDNGPSTINQTGGSVHVASKLFLDRQNKNNGTVYNLNGGTLYAGNIVFNGNSILNIAGGTFTFPKAYLSIVNAEISAEQIVAYLGEGAVDVDSTTDPVNLIITGVILEQALQESPADGSVDVPLDVALSWSAGDGAVSHNVYFGTTSPPSFVQNQTELTYDPPGDLNGITTYYWAIDEVNEANGVCDGDVWSFTTVNPYIASEPSPADESDDVEADVILNWTAGTTAVSHNVYFGTDFNDVNAANCPAGDIDGDGQVDWADMLVVAEQWLQDPPEGPGPSADLNDNDNVNLVDFAIVAEDWMEDADVVFKGNQALDANSYDPNGLEFGQTYYWRIDEVNNSYPNSLWKGNVWSFTSVAKDPDQWWQFRNDRGLTGRSRMLGSITGTPSILWSRFVGARETYVELQQAAGSSVIDLPQTDLAISNWNTFNMQWDLGSAYYDLDGTGSLTRIDRHRYYKIGDFLPEPGLEKVEATFFGDNGRLRLYKRQSGAWVQVWQTAELMPQFWQPEVIVGDFDGDGQDEVSVTPWYDLWMFDLTTGAFEQKCRYIPDGLDNGRGYGWQGAFDLDGDGKMEIIILGSLANYISVLGWETPGGQMTLVNKWDRIIEVSVQTEYTIVRPGPDPIQDIDGNGDLEMVICMFNHDGGNYTYGQGGYYGDNKWHTVAFDGVSGEVKLELPDKYLAGLRDIDGDGVAELLCSETSGQLMLDPGELTVYSFENEILSIRWGEPNSSFQMYLRPECPLNVNILDKDNFTALTGPIDAGGKLVFFTRKTVDSGTRTVEIKAWQADAGGSITHIATATGSYLSVLSVQPPDGGFPGGILTRAEVPRDVAGSQMSAWQADTSRLYSARIGTYPATAVVGKLSVDSPPAIVVEGAGELMEAFWPIGGGETELIWRQPGSGLAFSTGYKLSGSILADLDGDGNIEAMAATYGPGGCVRIVGYKADGSELWHHDFDQFQGGVPVWNMPGAIFWHVGRFSDPERKDILVTLRRGNMHSEQTHLLSGDDGHEIWSCHTTMANRAAGGDYMAIYDQNGDGLDDATIMFPSIFCVMSGPTGNILVGKVEDYWGTPVAADFLGNGSKQVLFAGSSEAFKLRDIQGNIIWQVSPPPVFSGMPGVGDVDSDGVPDILVFDGSGQVRCYEGATGSFKWTLGGLGSGQPSSPATVDIDGDGRDECIFAIYNMLYAVGAAADGLTGQILWQLGFPGNLGPPAIADVDGSKQPCIIVVGKDGYVYGVGQ